jgi:hypothetical protein
MNNTSCRRISSVVAVIAAVDSASLLQVGCIDETREFEQAVVESSISVPDESPAEEAEPSQAVTPALAASAGPYWIWFAHSGRCVTVPGNSMTNGTQLDQWDCVNPIQNNQRWVFDWTTDGHARIRNLHSQKCPNVSGGSTADGAAIIQWPCGNSPNEEWRGQFYTTVNGYDYYMLKARHSGKCLVVQNASLALGARLIQWTCSFGDTPNDVVSWLGPL